MANINTLGLDKLIDYLNMSLVISSNLTLKTRGTSKIMLIKFYCLWPFRIGLGPFLLCMYVSIKVRNYLFEKLTV